MLHLQAEEEARIRSIKEAEDARKVLAEKKKMAAAYETLYHAFEDKAKRRVVLFRMCSLWNVFSMEFVLLACVLLECVLLEYKAKRRVVLFRMCSLWNVLYMECVLLACVLLACALLECVLFRMCSL